MSVPIGSDRAFAASAALFRSIPSRSVFIWVLIFSTFLNLLVLVLPFYSIQVFDRVLSSGSVPTLIGLTGLAIGALFFYAIFDSIRDRLLMRFAVNFEQHVAPFVLKASIVDAANRVTDDSHDFVKLRELRNFFSSHTTSLIIDAPFIPLFMVVLWIIHPLYGMIAIFGGTLLGILATVSGRISLSERKQTARAAGHAQVAFDSIVRNANLIRAMGWTQGAIREFMRRNETALVPVARGSERVGAIAAVARMIRLCLQIAAVGAGSWLVLNNEVLPGSLMAAMIMISRTLAPMEGLLSAWRAVVSAWDAWKRVAVAVAVVKNPNTRTLLPPPTGALEVNHVAYYAPNVRKPIISNVSFRCPPGSIVVIIGPTGAGKSTLMRLMAGLEQPSRGSIRLDGSALENWDPDQLGQYVGYLPQDVALIGGTVAEAIAGFDENATDDDVVTAATRANVHAMILSLPKGYETEIGRDGNNLSGGQRQRVGLARAFFGNRKLILLDEPNSNLDPEGEEALCEAIKLAKSRGSTAVVVTHRPRILTVADWVLVMRDGARVAFGPPSEVVPQATAGATPMRRPRQAGGEDKARAPSIPKVS